MFLGCSACSWGVRLFRNDVEEDDVDDDFKLDLDAFVNIHIYIYTYICMYIHIKKYIYCLGKKRYKNSINASLF